MTPGSEPRHAAHESAEERLAEEVVEGLNLHETTAGKPAARKDDDEDEPLPPMSEQIAEQLGGVRGLVESSLPVFAFVVFNVVFGSVLDLEKRTALYWAIGGAVVSAVAIGGYRLYRKEPVRHAMNGLVGIAIGAYFAWRSGDAKDFYLPGILMTFGQAVVLLVSVLIRKPLIGYAWGIMANKGRQDWFSNGPLFRTFQWLTLVWVASLGLRGGIQFYLYQQGDANALGIVRLLVSWPIYAATFALTAWAIHRVTSRQKDVVETA